MNDWEQHYTNVEVMVTEAAHLIYEELGKIQFVNMKYKLYNEEESKWLYKVRFEKQEKNLDIVSLETGETIRKLPLDAIELLRLRPYYYARCVGFKNFLFYHDQG